MDSWSGWSDTSGCASRRGVIYIYIRYGKNLHHNFTEYTLEISTAGGTKAEKRTTKGLGHVSCKDGAVGAGRCLLLAGAVRPQWLGRCVPDLPAVRSSVAAEWCNHGPG